MSVKFDVNGAQNVEVSVKVPCEKTLEEQLAIMEAYTEAHKAHRESPKELREAACLQVLYPRLFRKIMGTYLPGGWIFCPSASGASPLWEAWGITACSISFWPLRKSWKQRSRRPGRARCMITGWSTI